MDSLKNCMRIGSSICALASALLLLVGVLLIPNVVLADQYIPNNVGICGGCSGNCPSSLPPCAVQTNQCNPTGTACPVSDNCQCGDFDGDGVCDCSN